MSEELKPCPFCGGPAEHDHDDDGYCWVQCRNCGVSTDTATHGNTDARVKLADMWNTRATLSPAHIEDGEEVEVVAHLIIPAKGSYKGRQFAASGTVPAESSPLKHYEPLMTVAQHQRIVAAHRSERAALMDTFVALCDYLGIDPQQARKLPGKPSEVFIAAIEARAALSAPPAADDGMCNADNPASRCECREEFGHRVCAAPPAAGVPGHAEFLEWAERVLDAEQERLSAEDYLMDSEDCIKVLREAAAPTPPASEQPLSGNISDQEWINAGCPPASEQQRAVVIPNGSVLVGKSVLALVRNSLKRDAESGLQVRGEILAELDQSIARYDRLVSPDLAKGEGV